MTRYDIAKFYGYNSPEEYDEAEKRKHEIFTESLKRQKPYVEKEPVKIPPAVHCKDCKYAQNPNDTMIYCTYFECGTMSQNDFCSHGERNTENENN